MTTHQLDQTQLEQLARRLGFTRVGISEAKPSAYTDKVTSWVEAGHHGTMSWMERNLDMRCNPTKLHEGSLSIISVSLPYLPDAADALENAADPARAFISRYALGRDYHKLYRKKLVQLAQEIEQIIGPLGHRVFVDSAPVLEREIAQRAGLGFIGKNCMLIHPEDGSYTFLGEIFTTAPLEDSGGPVEENCGKCTACHSICPTDAFLENGRLDAQRCISYLTIEHEGAIDEELRPLMGNRIFGCDDCQIICPFNRAPTTATIDDFEPRHHLDTASLLDLWSWTEPMFLSRFEGSTIRRSGWARWRRNLATALGNGPADIRAIEALEEAVTHPQPEDFVLEHIEWALQKLKRPEHKPEALPLNRFKGYK